jgi:prepilin-type N-terminal cleavage/methylation domain-containing protein
VVRQRLSGLDRHGFSAVELIVVVAIVGIIAAISIPSLITYFQASTLKGGTEEVSAALNLARQLAITQNRSVCFQVVGNQYRYLPGACAGAPLTVPGRDANGFFRLSNNVQLTQVAPVPPAIGPVFNSLGAATTAATLTVTYVNQAGTPGASRNVTVAASGRILIQ